MFSTTLESQSEPQTALTSSRSSTVGANIQEGRWEHTRRLAAMCCWITSYVTWKHVFLAAVPQAAELTKQLTATKKAFSFTFPSSSLLKPSSQREYPARTKRMLDLLCFFWFLGWGNYTEVMKLRKGNHWLGYGILTWKPIKILG